MYVSRWYTCVCVRWVYVWGEGGSVMAWKWQRTTKVFFFVMSLAGVRSKEIFAIIVDSLMDMAPMIICSMIVSVLAPPMIQIVGELLGR